MNKDQSIRMRFFGLHNASRNVLPLLLIGLLIGLAHSSITAFGPLYISSQVIRGADVLPMYAALFALSTLLSGYIYAKRATGFSSSKVFLTYSLTFAVAGYIFLSQTQHWGPGVYIAAILLGAGASCIAHVYGLSGRIFASLSEGDIPFANSSLRCAFSVGWIVGPILGSWLISKFDYLGMFLGCSFITGLALLVTRSVWQASNHAENSTKNSVKAMAGANWRLYSLVFSLFLLNFSNMLSGVALPLYIKLQIGGTESSIGYALGLAALVELPLMFLVGAKAQVRSIWLYMLFGAFVGSFYYILVYATSNMVIIFALQLLAAGSVSIVMSLGLTYLQQSISLSAESSGTIYSSTFSVASLSISFALYLVTAYKLPYGDLFLLCGLMSALSALLIAGARLRGSSYFLSRECD